MKKEVDAIRKSGKKVVLYGAGIAGKQVCNYLEEKYKLPIACYGDSNIDKINTSYNGKKVLSLNEIKENYVDSVLIITAYDKQVVEEIKTHLVSNGYVGKILSFYELCSGTDSVEAYRDICADYHKENMDDYFENAESKELIDIFWNKDSVFYQMFKKLDLNNVIELACGRGRHVSQYLDDSGYVTLVDILEENILICRERFGENRKIKYYKNSGYDLKELEDSKYTALFTYDAMVHFESIDIYHYLLEVNRVLKQGGMALFHHSNNHSDYKASFINSISGSRNYMSTELFAHFADRAGLEIVEQKVIDWEIKELDAVTLVVKR